jgi:opacity protein-like surface antigen
LADFARAVVLVLASIAFVARGARAQSDEDRPRLGIDRLGSYVSYTWVDDAQHGWDIGAELDVGSIATPKAHLVVGLNYLEADIDRKDVTFQGSFHDFSATADLRFTLFRYWRFEPFAGAGVGVHFLGNDIDGPESFRSEYDGTKVGGQFFGGTAFDITSDRQWSAYAEVRRIAVSTVGRTTLRLGAFVRL